MNFYVKFLSLSWRMIMINITRATSISIALRHPTAFNPISSKIIPDRPGAKAIPQYIAEVADATQPPESSSAAAIPRIKGKLKYQEAENRKYIVANQVAD